MLHPYVIALAATAFAAALVPAQQVRGRLGLFVGAPQAPQAGSADDPGTPVEMFENPNLDRYLRNAQGFLSRANFEAAIKVLQDVIEGRTIEVVAARPEDGAGGADGPPATAPAPAEAPRSAPATDDPRSGNAPQVPRGPRPNERDSRNAVFSQDGRLYRPVRRLCHELLARLPDVGVELYRATYEVAAEELLQAALRDGTTAALEQVANRYFITLAAGRAMALLGDRLMHEGRYRGAVQVWRDLLDVYPPAGRQRLGISEVWCRFKIALCLRLAGEVEAAHAAVAALAVSHPDESLRLQGELQSVKDLPTSEWFARDVQAMAVQPRASTGLRCLQADTDELVPLWQYRFRNPDPYKDPKNSNNDGRVFWEQGVQSSLMPYASRYGPATWVVFGHDRADGLDLPRALFFEHFRLRSADAGNGLLLAQGDGSDEPPVARENQPRLRIAASDFALLRPVEDEERRYVVLGRKTAAASLEVLKTSELIAYRRDLGQQVWNSTAWNDGEGGLREVTFLAAPVVFGERLLLPALRRGGYSLECLDRRTGQPLWNTPIHAGGTPFFKAPGCQVVVQGGIALVTTNAGCIAAVDAFAGDLRWIRRYERVDPARKGSRGKRAGGEDGQSFQPQFPQAELNGFLPNDMVVHEGVAIVAPCDGDLLVCVDIATGQMVWYVDAVTHYAPYGRLRSLVGTDGTDLFLCADTHLIAIGLTGGLVKWAQELPTWNGPKAAGRGRGVVVGDQVVLPGQRELLVFHTAGKSGLRRLPLPAFDSSRDPLAGPYDITVDGPWLALGYPGGVEMFSTKPALEQLAARTTEPLRKAEFLLQASHPDQAEAELVTALRTGVGNGAVRQALATQLLALVDNRATGLARGGDLPAALAAFDGVLALLTERTVLLNWHLARVEMCKEIGELRAHEREQERLYAYMEGKR